MHNMGRDRDRQSRFGPPNNYNSSNSAIPLMSLKSGTTRNNYSDDLFSSQNFGSSSSSSYKTPEQLAFDNEFKKWEKSFEDWKRAYASHPDRVAYREYENKFLDVREKLMEKRKQIYNEGPGGGGSSNSFDNYLSAADAMANSILSKFDSKPQKDFRDDDQYRGGYSRDNRDDMYGQGSGYGRDFGSNDRSYGGNDRGYSSNDRNYGSNDRGSSNRSFGGNDRSYGSNNDRGFGSRERSFGGNNDRSFGSRERSFGGNNDRSFGRNSSRDDQRGGRDNNQREGRDRRGLGFDKRDSRGMNRGGGGRDFQNRGGRDFGRRNDRFGGPLRKPSQEQIEKELKRRDVYPNTRWKLITKDPRPALVGKRAKKVNNKIQKVIEKKKAIAAGEVPLEELPFSEKVDKLFEMAQKAELPKLLPGSAKRRLNNIKKKNDADLTADERKFVAYCEYVNIKRVKYFDEKKKREEEEAKQKSENPPPETAMEQEPSQS
ncbi:uncharacterized protein [Chironomus tepperi]|uniref:uncharacterized protein n=1 Tax=Chironomus tepperi TaxID=113505 RepID=UPI00391F56F9